MGKVLRQQSPEQIRAMYKPEWVQAIFHWCSLNHEEINTFLSDLPRQRQDLVSTEPKRWIDFVNLQFQLDKNGSLINRGHAFVNCINPLVVVLMLSEEMGISGKRIPSKKKARGGTLCESDIVKKCQV